jgi:hypothetical protein
MTDEIDSKIAAEGKEHAHKPLADTKATPSLDEQPETAEPKSKPDREPHHGLEIPSPTPNGVGL